MTRDALKADLRTLKIPGEYGGAFPLPQSDIDVISNHLVSLGWTKPPATPQTTSPATPQP
jgi:hypothetical protein